MTIGGSAQRAYQREFNSDGMRIFATNSGALASEAAVTLYQLEDEGYAVLGQDGYFLAWDQVYRMIESGDYVGAADLFQIPSPTDAVPAVHSHGALTDPDFAIYVSEWFDGANQPLRGAEAIGGLLKRQGGDELLSYPVWRLTDRIRQFRGRPADQHTGDAHRLSYGLIRSDAIRAKAILDDFLISTIVLTPERLRLDIRKADFGGSGLLEVIPGFDGAPPQWLDRFDQFSTVQRLYNIPTDRGIVQVVVPDDLSAVLSAIKELPGRRIAGERAEQFLLDPVAALGEGAGKFIDDDQFTQAKHDAGIINDRFVAFARRDANGSVESLGIAATPIVAGGGVGGVEVELTDDEALAFIALVRSKFESEHPLCGWEDYVFELDGDSLNECEALEKLIAERRQPFILISHTDIYDLAGYSGRIDGIGIEKPICSPYVARKTDENGEGPKWLPKEIIPIVSWSADDGSDPTIVAFSQEALSALKVAVGQALAKGEPTVDLAGMPGPIPRHEAENIIRTFARVYEEAELGAFNPPRAPDFIAKPLKASKPSRLSLLIKGNIDSVDYVEARRDLLTSFDRASPVLPSTLKEGVALKDHQIEGLAWLQHLFGQGPGVCRGALLADDMGLGKTLQLLCLIVSLRERDPGLAPALIVAPLSLLENWKGEVRAFFKPGALKVLTAYGDDLRALRVPKSAVQQSLVAQGLTKFLKPNWRADADVVLTTYETLRDLQFSFARESWSLLICDEAQKIKNPGAAMTTAAKKQNVRFRIACTGTPVENSLTDLWSLFDFVQPGMLGSLNEFGRNFKRPIEAETDEDRARIEQLRALIEPQILRRMKRDVAKDLKDKIEVPSALHPQIADCKSLPLSVEQRTLYAKAIELFNTRNQPGSISPFKEHLGLLHYLRILCTDPQRPGLDGFVPEPLDVYRRKAPKLDWLIKELSRIQMLGEKVIIFCEFKNIQRLLRYYINEVFAFPPDIINGDTAVSSERFDSRQERLRAFQEKAGFGVIILSPVAVGFGVNIQAANHVIHYTRTWNPAKEDQASDRAYRIGQLKDVYVYCPTMCADDFVTLDVHIDKLLTAKRKLAGDMLNGSGDIRVSDFDLAEFAPPGMTIDDPRITIDDVSRMSGQMFEAFTALLWAKQGASPVLLTPESQDRGVDVVALTKTSGTLIQCKRSSPDKHLNWDAIKEVVAGRAYYRKLHPDITFTLACVTNAQFNGYAREQARENDVELVEGSDIQNLLARIEIRFSDLEKFSITSRAPA